MIREKKDFPKTVVGNSYSNSVEKEKKGEKEEESNTGKEVQYEVTYVGTAQQVE